MESVTYVTALYNLRKREGNDNVDCDQFCSINTYLTLAKRLLDTPNPFVIFCEPVLEAPLRALRGDRPTTIVVIDFEDLPYWHLLPKITENNVERSVVWVAPEKFTNLYYIIINHKAEFVRQAADANTFNTEWFAWVDMRICLPETGVSGITRGWDPERANVTMMQPIDRNRVNDRYGFFRNYHGWIAGGFFAGKRGPILRFTQTVLREWVSIVDEGYSPSDEVMFAYVLVKYPDMVSATSFGGHSDLIYNQPAIRNKQWIAYCIQEAALNEDDLRTSIAAGEALRRGYLAGYLDSMHDHEKFHIFYRLMQAYEKTGQTELAAARRTELFRPEMAAMREQFTPRLLPCDLAGPEGGFNATGPEGGFNAAV